MDIEGVTDFITLAECRSFSRAAKLRFVTQPAFSRRIKALEDKVGAALVDRTVTPVALTPAGERFLVYAYNIAELAEKAADEVQARASALENPVRISMPRSLSITFFPAWYSKMQKKIPDLTISLASHSGSKSIGEINKGLSDLAIIIKADTVTPCFDSENLQYRVIGKDTMHAVRAAHASRNALRFLAYNNGSYMNECAQELLKISKAPKMKTYFESSSSDLLRQMALTGFGTAVLQESLVADDLRDGFLVPAFKPAKTLPCNILLVRTRAKLPPKAEAVWAGVKNCQ